jgi:hypothetical protein
VEWEDGRREAVIFVLEEHTDPQRFQIHKLAHYVLDIAELYATDRIVPVTIFLRDGAPGTHLNLGTEYCTYLQFQYLACRLRQVEAKAFFDSANLVARLSLPLMNHSADQKLQVYHQAMTGLFELENRVEYQQKYIDFVDYYADLSDQELEQYEQTFINNSQLRETIMGAFQRRLQEVETRMMKQGIEQGEAAVLIKLASKRFGELPDSAIAQFKSASSAQLESWADRLLEVGSVEELLGQ